VRPLPQATALLLDRATNSHDSMGVCATWVHNNVLKDAANRLVLTQYHDDLRRRAGGIAGRAAAPPRFLCTKQESQGGMKPSPLTHLPAKSHSYLLGRLPAAWHAAQQNLHVGALRRGAEAMCACAWPPLSPYPLSYLSAGCMLCVY
jgi:hypothetical protein